MENQLSGGSDVYLDLMSDHRAQDVLSMLEFDYINADLAAEEWINPKNTFKARNTGISHGLQLDSGFQFFDENCPARAALNNEKTTDKPLFRVCAYIREGFVLENLNRTLSNCVEFAVLKAENIKGVPKIHDLIDVLQIKTSEGRVMPQFDGGVTKPKKAALYHEAIVASISKEAPQTKTFYGVMDYQQKTIVTEGLETVRILKNGNKVNFLECRKPFSIDVFVSRKSCQLAKNWTPSYTIESSRGEELRTEMLKDAIIFKMRGGTTGSQILCHPNDINYHSADAVSARSEDAVPSLDPKYRFLLEANRMLLGAYVQASYDSVNYDLSKFDVSCKWVSNSAFKGSCTFPTDLPLGYGKGVQMSIAVKDELINVQTTKIGVNWFWFRVLDVSEARVLSIYDNEMVAGIKGQINLSLLNPDREPLVYYIDHHLERNLRSNAESGEDGTAAGIGLQLLREQEVNRRVYNQVPHDKIECDGDQRITLDEEQQLAVHSIAYHPNAPPFCVLTACPGTGKTLCAAAIIKATARRGKSVQLVLAETNNAVNNMAEVLHRGKGVRILRIFAHSAFLRDEGVEPDYGLNRVIARLTAEKKALTASQLRMFQEYQQIAERMKKMESLKGEDRSKGTLYQQLKEVKDVMTEAVNEVVMAVYRPHVILTTTDFYLRHRLRDEMSTAGIDAITKKPFINAYSVFFSKQRFSRLLIEEASLLDVIRFTALMAVSRKIDQIVLVGDPKQMSPYYSIIGDPTLKTFGYDSTLERLLANKSCVHFTLSIGYRSHPKLQELTKLFYSNLQRRDSPELLQRWENNRDALWDLWGEFSKNKGPLMFVQVENGQNEKNRSCSRRNNKEAEKAVELIKEALRSGVKPQNLGVICLYSGQVALIMTELRKTEMPHEEIEVATVDSFQGREKHYILLLTTRTAGNSEGDFIVDKHRMNVATSRAIHGMVILGHSWLFKAWPEVYTFCKEARCIREC